jgi:hypothetical protein
MNDGVEILLSFPLVIEQAVGSFVHGQFSETLPPIGLPLNGAIGAVELADAVAGVLGLAVGFKLGEVGAFAVAFNGAVHGW